ncbi:hypothetical protein [Chengkuizengella marina]|uniref:Uncharacterized protein n=1 Tax=Chengkuizengella marina TaxID=2507566 RepID=A0A6N9Q8Z5_9BACL|nr:hypothetical protein [Chengkuizengella marina]NBI31103.1 hypothetical protein [Chengkuizengella marina]
MKLIGSKTEQEFREQLVKSNKSLFEEQEKNGLLSTIKRHFPNMKTAYIIRWILEQGEDIYKVLIDDNLITEIELSRYDQSIKPIVKTISISKYKQGLSKNKQIKLAVAIDLAQKDIENKK